MPRKTYVEEFPFDKVYSKKDFFADSFLGVFFKKLTRGSMFQKIQEREICIA